MKNLLLNFIKMQETICYKKVCDFRQKFRKREQEKRK